MVVGPLRIDASKQPSTENDSPTVVGTGAEPAIVVDRFASDGVNANDGVNAGRDADPIADGELPVGPAPADLPPITSPQQYHLQFTTTEEHVQLLERAKALMARERPGVSLGELHLEAMKLLVASLEKRKFAVGAGSKTRQRGNDSSTRQRGDDSSKSASISEASPGAGAQASGTARQRSRHIPASLQREVYERDAGRCSYFDERGQRCCETRYLQLHHVEPFARGGVHEASNLALRCPAHNHLAAEQDFGQQLVAARRDAPRHESRSRQRLDSRGSR